ncbi:hypothetical protein O1611_g790 [Lasiodiplodia mahajangana]|uniref:Uncharacterized protein n=1 Tax=Lasiodiplodia mahajangana TaxID=1108764 RepID=A0ACC2JZY7_9PEZI|nr:hypothetical protein O1611_g790 [Lasiodiplodia mahajangana]
MIAMPRQIPGATGTALKVKDFMKRTPSMSNEKSLGVEGRGIESDISRSEKKLDITMKRLGGRRLWLVSASLDKGMFTLAFEMPIVASSVVAITTDLAGIGSRSWLLTAFLLGYAAIISIVSKLSDIPGRRLLYTLCMLGLLIPSVACSAAQTTTQPIIPAFQSAINVEPLVIPSNYSFSETQAALEAAIPPLNLTFQTYLARSDYAGAHEALENLPPLNNFILPPRNFTGLLLAIGQSGQAIQYEIGNPLTAITMAQHNLDISLHTPRRVLLRVDGDKVEFKFDALAPLVAKFRIPEVDILARRLDAELVNALHRVAR